MTRYLGTILGVAACLVPATALAQAARTLEPPSAFWHLAPRSMAWQGRSLGQICEQIKDPARNRGRSLPQIVEHVSHGTPVAWGWAPGAGREPAPGSQAVLGELIRAWVDTCAAGPAS
jgi:hypothetical protein